MYVVIPETEEGFTDTMAMRMYECNDAANAYADELMEAGYACVLIKHMLPE